MFRDLSLDPAWSMWENDSFS